MFVKNNRICIIDKDEILEMRVESLATRVLYLQNEHLLQFFIKSV